VFCSIVFILVSAPTTRNSVTLRFQPPAEKRSFVYRHYF